MTEIPFSGRLQERDYREIQALAMKKMYRIILIVFFALVLVNLATGWRQMARDPYGVFITWLPVAIFAPAVVLVQWFVVRRHWRNNKAIQRPAHGFVSQQGIVWNVEDISVSKFPWDLLLRYRESANLVLVYQALNQVFYFPRHYFSSPEHWEAFRELVAKHLPKK